MYKSNMMLKKSNKTPRLGAKEMHLCQFADLILVLGFVAGDPM